MRMLSGIIAIAAVVSLAGCSSDDKPTGPANNGPVITSVQVEPNPVPRNKTADLIVVASDPDHDSLIYSWTATAGTFSGGASNDSVTWVPPQTMASYAVSVTVSDGKATADTTIQIDVGKAVYQVSGTIINQFGAPAQNIYVVAGSAGLPTDSVLTDALGTFVLNEVAEGVTAAWFRSPEAAAYGAPRYLPSDTEFVITSDCLLNAQVREFYFVYQDYGTSAANWEMFGGVRTDGQKYIFEDAALQADYMTWTSPVTVPAELDSLYLAIGGWVSPSDSGYIRTGFWVGGAELGYAQDVFYPTRDVHFWIVHNLQGIIGAQLSLKLEMFTYVDPVSFPATSTLVDEIVLFGY